MTTEQKSLTKSADDTDEIITYEQLREERDRYRRELQELSGRLQASAGIVQHGLLRKFEALEGCIRAERLQHRQSECTCHSRCRQCDQTCCTGATSGNKTAPSVSIESRSRGRPKRDCFDISYPEVRNQSQAAAKPKWALTTVAKGTEVGTCQRCRMTESTVNYAAFSPGHNSAKLMHSPASAQSSAASKFDIVSPKAVESTDSSVQPRQTQFKDNSPEQDVAVSFEPAAADNNNQEQAAAVYFDPAAADNNNQEQAAAVSFDPAAADNNKQEQAAAVSFDPAASKSTRKKLFSSLSSDPASFGTSPELSSAGSSDTASLGDSQEQLLASDGNKPSGVAAGSQLNKQQSPELLRFDCSQSETDSQQVFPSLPNSHLARLGLLPTSLAELKAANEAVSIVDTNSRYRMEGPAGSSESSTSPMEVSTEDRIRDLAISFANDAATVGERAKRASLARARVETNFDEELRRLLKLLDSVASAGAPETAAEASQAARLLGDIAAGLSRNAQTLGAVEQECRLNFAFHLILKHSEEMRSNNEKMSGELELLRQAVEDDQFYTDGDSSLSRRYGNKCPAGSEGDSGMKGKAKFQQLGRSVARTSSVAALLQRLARERERRRRHEQRKQSGSVDEVEPRPTEYCDDGASGEGADDDEADSSSSPKHHLGRPGSDEAAEEDQTVLDRLDRLSMRLFADRRVRLFLAPLALLAATICLLWALAYPIAKRLLAG